MTDPDHHHDPSHRHDHPEQPGEEDTTEHRPAPIRFLLDGRLAVVDNPADLVDHGGREVDPVHPSGHPYQWRMRRPDSPRTFYGSDAEAICTVLIDNYPDPVENHTRETFLAAYDARARLAIGVIMNHAAAAYLSGDLTPEQETQLQQSTEHTPELPAITSEQLPRWDHPKFPLVLLRELYQPEETGIYPPAGNVTFIRCHSAEQFIHDLNALGHIRLTQDDSYTQLPPSRITFLRPDQPADPTDGPDNDDTPEDSGSSA